MKSHVALYIVIVTGVFGYGYGQFMLHEHRLMTDLLFNYSSFVRPVLSYDNQMIVNFRLILLNIHELDEARHTLKSEVFFRQNWTDYQLQWNPKDYDGIKSIRIPIEKIWNPQIVLHNNAGYDIEYSNNLALVTWTGEVIWMPHAYLRSFCDVDFTEFPFDTQRCDLVFGSWAYEKKQMDVRLHSNDTDDFQDIRFVNDGKEWEIDKVIVLHEDFTYLLGYVYPYIRYSFVMRREATLYRHFFIVPGVMLAFLTLYIFFIPPESGERITLAVGILISDILLTMLLERHIPTDAGIVPVIGKYYAYLLVMIMFVILESVFQLTCYHRQAVDGLVPKWMKTLCLGSLSTLMCVEKITYTTVPTNPLGADSFSEFLANDDRLPIVHNGDGSIGNRSMDRMEGLEETLRDIRKYLKICADQATGNAPQEVSHKQLVLKEWRRIAVVCDRLVFWIFTVLTFAATFAFCLK